MKRTLLFTSLALLGASIGFAQQNKKTFSISGDGSNDFVWMNIRQVDLSNGQVVKTLFDRNHSQFSLTDINTQQVVTHKTFVGISSTTASDFPTGSFVAAAAYDQKMGRLFFAPMKMAALRWLDLRDASDVAQFYTMSPAAFKQADPTDEANSISRMAIAANGNGYALTNDANHFYQFTTGKKPEVIDLGSLTDAEKNGGNSIHNKCSSWGGDMIADAFGKLYVISANHYVYQIDISNRIATYLGSIQGLPASFTTNAAAVNDDGDIVVSSANQWNGYFKFNIKELKAVKIEGSESKYNASDFANANLLLQKEADAAAMLATGSGSLSPWAPAADSKIFPNPVTQHSFSVLMDNQPEGKYLVILSDLAGRSFLTKEMSNVSKGSTSTIKVQLSSQLAKGMYWVKVMDQHHNVIINEKIFVQ